MAVWLLQDVLGVPNPSAVYLVAVVATAIVSGTAGAIGTAYLPTLLLRLGIHEREIALCATIIIPIVLIGTMFRQWADVRAELRHEASLGLIDDADVRSTAHPFLRLTRAGWSDPAAHREFVRIANRIALRKRQQRNRPDEMARLYQLEIIKLRMKLQEMSRIDHASRAASAPVG